jgi:hypothetical protein
MTRGIDRYWSPWYAHELENKVTCQICGNSFTKKNCRMLSHLGYIQSNGKRDTNVKLCKNMKPDVGCVFRGCGGVAPTPLEPIESQHLQGSAQSEEPICQGTPSSIIYKSYGASQNLTTTSKVFWNSSAATLQLSASTGPSSAWSRQQSIILECHAKD